MTTTKKEILDFIDELNKDPAVTANFHNELSYWWSVIMEARFKIFESKNQITILFNPTEENFAITINGIAYNTYGVIPPSSIDEYVSWLTYCDNQPAKANEILRTKAYLIKDKEAWSNLCTDFFSKQAALKGKLNDNY